MEQAQIMDQPDTDQVMEQVQITDQITEEVQDMVEKDPYVVGMSDLIRHTI